ncbi:MAG: hypothetical protein HY606_15540 [Planctomycetes bacterium]|nr:hypothetical protein [Planctomycetota bacterium]
MSESVIVLTPNIETAEDFNRIGKQLSEIAIDYLTRIEFEHIPEEELKPHLDAILIWKQFGNAFRRGKGLFITWEEIRSLPFSMLENTLKFMFDKEYLKEIRIDYSLADSPLCPFCRKPSAHPNKTKHLIFFKKIVSWSCNYDKCPSYGKPYNFEWYG